MESVRLASATRWTNDHNLRSAVVHRTFAMLKQLGRSGMRRRSCAAEQKRLEGSDAYSTVTFSRHRRRRFSRRTVRAGHLVFEPEGQGGENDRRDSFRSSRTNPVEEGTEYSVQPEA